MIITFLITVDVFDDAERAEQAIGYQLAKRIDPAVGILKSVEHLPYITEARAVEIEKQAFYSGETDL
jgi:hypothetical protein